MPRERERVNEKKGDFMFIRNNIGRMLVYMHMYTCMHTYMHALTRTHTHTHNIDTRVNVLTRGLANGATPYLHPVDGHGIFQVIVVTS